MHTTLHWLRLYIVLRRKQRVIVNRSTGPSEVLGSRLALARAQSPTQVQRMCTEHYTRTGYPVRLHSPKNWKVVTTTVHFKWTSFILPSKQFTQMLHRSECPRQVACVPSVLSSEHITHRGTQPCPVPSQVDGVYIVGKAAHLCLQNSGICSQQRALRGSQGHSLKVTGHRRQQESDSTRQWIFRNQPFQYNRTSLIQDVGCSVQHTSKMRETRKVTQPPFYLMWPTRTRKHLFFLSASKNPKTSYTINWPVLRGGGIRLGKYLHCSILPYWSVIESNPCIFVVHPRLLLHSTLRIIEAAFFQAVHSFSAQPSRHRARSTTLQPALNTITARTLLQWRQDSYARLRAHTWVLAQIFRA